MPRGDQSGPMGEGPMTGRAMGFCAGYDRPGFANGPGYGMGRGFGPGWGRGRAGGRGGFGGRGMAWGRGYGWGPGPSYGAAYGPYGGAPASKENRKQALQGEVNALEEQLRFLKREMEAMDKDEEQQ